jgi:hypothetical protein
MPRPVAITWTFVVSPTTSNTGNAGQLRHFGAPSDYPIVDELAR